MIRRAVPYALVALAACLGWFGLPSAADARQPASPRRIGVVLVGWSPESKEAQQFRQGLREARYFEGRDVVIEWRSANGDYNRVPGLVTELLQSKVDVIVVDGTVTAKVAKRSTSTIPIVMAFVGDPVGSGLVTNLPRPGANVTGLSLMTVELTTKRLQLLKDTIPRLTRVAVLWNQDNPNHAKVVSDLKAAAPSLSIELKFVSARTPEEFDPAFSAVNKAHAQALYVVDDPVLLTHRIMLVKRASKLRLPAIYAQKDFTHEGGLMSYGPNFGDLFRRSAWYVDKILKGAKPGDLPIEQPTRFEFVVNLRTAKALGLTIPQSVLLQADDVIR